MKHGTTGENTPNIKVDEFDIPSLSAAQLDSLRPLDELRPETQAMLSKGKTRITIMLDNDILAVFRDRAEKQTGVRLPNPDQRSAQDLFGR